MKNKRVYIIAEAGVNHNGDKEIARKLIDVAVKAGADAVKFQVFKSKKLVTGDAVKADYQISNTGRNETQVEMLKKLELSHKAFKELHQYASNKKIDFLSTAFDNESLKFLVRTLRLGTLKIPSGEITNLPFLLEHALSGCKLILSTGLAKLGEIEQALAVIAYGYVRKKKGKPTQEDFEQAYLSKEGQKKLKEKVTILHCTSEYPAPYDEINLKALTSLKKTFRLPVGYSDHSAGIAIPLAAVARNASIIEKHFTLDKNMEGPDHKASLEPDELRAMVKGIREVEKALGSGIKYPQVSEIRNRDVVRRSLVADKAIRKGEIFTAGNLSVKRPGKGMQPSQYWGLLGQKARKNYRQGDFIDE